MMLKLGESDLTKKVRQVAEYTAASSLLHCADGWGYFGRAIHAVSVGSLATAQHLAYYAELRAAVALLGRSGILVANNRHYIVTGNAEVKRVSSEGTHRAAWNLLNDWAALPASISLVSRIIRLEGYTLAEWIAAKPTVMHLPSTLPDLLRNWGLDLQEYSADRDRRNAASYRPTRITPQPARPDSAWIVECIEEVWRLLEPGAPGTFPNLDLFLIRGTLDALHAGARGRAALARPAYEKELSQMVAATVGLPAGGALLSALAPGTRAKPPTVLRETLTLRPGKKRDPQAIITAMLGRALIMLRLATGAVRDLQQHAGVSPHDVRLWADEVGLNHGLWPEDDRPSPIETLWGDVDVALDDLVDAATSPGRSELAHLHVDAGAALLTLSTFERVAVWGMSA